MEEKPQTYGIREVDKIGYAMASLRRCVRNKSI